MIWVAVSFLRVPNETIEVPEETQEHIEICEGTQNERRVLDMLS